MTAYFTGDVPVGAFIVVPKTAGNIVPLDDFTSASVALYDGSGAAVTAEGLAATIAEGDDDISITWPSTSPFATAGIFSLVVTLHAAGGGQIATDPFQFVVQTNDGWHNLGTARTAWTTGAPKDDVQLYGLLATAKLQCSTFAPALADGAAVPSNYRDAQIMQARNTLNGLKEDPSQQSDSQPFAPIRPYPLDSFVKALLRPKRAVPRFG